ncbi:hypothetical protein [Pedobacter sp. MC2016-24]|uniref:hypothetical protein n=1 Tax=Pedobacter sp. MC2016-24 TaxID=2780090 RepID=UPI00187F3D1D|nr:hypothetical protein [Pedobacter sp. MC2016-24]MBE9601961.1 hypothetical protein [Pedobacter sp. MC2016-24]
MTELDYFDSLLDVIEKDLPYQADEEVDRIEMSSSMIKNLIRMRLVADPNTMLDEQFALKKRCCDLLARTYSLVAMKSEKDTAFGKKLMRNVILMSLTKQLEELFFLLTKFGEIRMSDL